MPSTDRAVSDPSPPVAVASAPARLALASFLVLFFELACIRWYGSTVVFLTFFTNIVLLASFLGMSVGLLNASRRRDFLRSTIPLAALAAGLAQLVFWLWRNSGVLVSVGDQRGSPQVIYFGTEYATARPDSFVVPIEVVAIAFFALIAAAFVGLGQTMGRAFDAIGDRVRAYTIDICGSLAGIAAFGLCSYLETPPTVWFAIALAGVVALLARRRLVFQVGMACLAVIFVSGALTAGDPRHKTFWSPYYKIVYSPRTGNIQTNNIGHQEMHRVLETAPAYVLPHLLNRDAGNAPFADVMIVGAGSGNDVAAALAYGARHVDAVEIEPVINRIGRADHPDRPYDDPRVTVRLDDGRSFARRTDATYDLAIYALVDSLVLHSGYSSIRLESFLFTEQAFRDVKARLKPGGIFATYNFYRQGWIVGRIAAMSERVFGTKPVVISLPYQSDIRAADGQANHITFVLSGTDASALDRIREQFAEHGNFWLNGNPGLNADVNGYAEAPPTESGWLRISPATVETGPAIGPLPSDDWPQLYLRERRIPDVSLRGALLIGACSLAMLAAFTIRPRRGDLDGSRFPRPDAAMFFLGAGFMLLETKGVVHMALLFGSTWVVNSVVFAAVLVMILCANLFVSLARPRRLWPSYALLLASLAVNALVPMDWFLALPGAWKTIASCAVVFVPVFFAGVIFATRFRESRKPGVDFGSNVAGVILGGLSENLSLVLGFNHLLLVAVGYYVLAAIGGAIADRRRFTGREIGLTAEPKII